MKFAYFTRRLLHFLRQALFQSLFTSVFLFAACMVVRQYYLIRHSRIVWILYALCTHYLTHTTMPSIHFWIKNRTCTTQVYCLHILFTNTSLLLKKIFNQTKFFPRHICTIFCGVRHNSAQDVVLNFEPLQHKWVNKYKKWEKVGENG